MAILSCPQTAKAQVVYFPFIDSRITLKKFEEHWQKMFDTDIDLTLANLWGTHPMLVASAFGNTQLVEEFYKRDASVLDMGDSTGWTAMFYAVFAQRTRTVKTLYALGAVINIATIKFWRTHEGIIPIGATCLWVAAQITHDVGICKLLLKIGGIAHPKLDSTGELVLSNAKKKLAKERLVLMNTLKNHVGNIFPSDLLKLIALYAEHL